MCKAGIQLSVKRKKGKEKRKKDRLGNGDRNKQHLAALCAVQAEVVKMSSRDTIKSS
jgi:hypothetical protein